MCFRIFVSLQPKHLHEHSTTVIHSWNVLPFPNGSIHKWGVHCLMLMLLSGSRDKNNTLPLLPSSMWNLIGGSHWRCWTRIFLPVLNTDYYFIFEKKIKKKSLGWFLSTFASKVQHYNNAESRKRIVGKARRLLAQVQTDQHAKERIWTKTNTKTKWTKSSSVQMNAVDITLKRLTGEVDNVHTSGYAGTSQGVRYNRQQVNSLESQRVGSNKTVSTNIEAILTRARLWWLDQRVSKTAGLQVCSRYAPWSTVAQTAEEPNAGYDRKVKPDQSICPCCLVLFWKHLQWECEHQNRTMLQWKEEARSNESHFLLSRSKLVEASGECSPGNLGSCNSLETYFDSLHLPKYCSRPSTPDSWPFYQQDNVPCNTGKNRSRVKGVDLATIHHSIWYGICGMCWTNKPGLTVLNGTANVLMPDTTSHLQKPCWITASTGQSRFAGTRLTYTVHIGIKSWLISV